MKLLEENIEDKILDIDLGSDFFGQFIKRKSSKRKYEQGLHQTEKLLHSKGSYQQNEKATYPTKQEKIFAKHVSEKGLFWIYKGLIQLSSKTTTTTKKTSLTKNQAEKKNWAEDLNRYFSKEDRWPTGT